MALAAAEATYETCDSVEHLSGDELVRGRSGSRMVWVETKAAMRPKDPERKNSLRRIAVGRFCGGFHEQS
jgi:hypothetical protein